MVHPSELLRTNSNEVRTFSAPRNVTDENQLDCGLTNLPILNRCCNLERFANPKVFLVFLSLVGFLQGVTLTYFRETARLWGKHYNISRDNIDWLIYTNEFFAGIIAFVVAFYGNKLHRVSWLGGLTIFQSISSGILIVPEVYRRSYINVNVTDVYLCPASPAPQTPEEEVNYIAFVVLGIFQIVFAMATVSFITHGITYVDDNTSANTSPGYIGIALACRELGRQAGLYFSWIPAYFNVNAVFISPVWLTIASAAFIVGTLISMFPKSMPSALIKTLAASLVDLASGHVPQKKQVVDGFFKTFSRLLTNPVLMVNIFYGVLMQSGLINFNIFEKFFNQSRFQVAYETDKSYTQFTTNILKQPLVAISIIATGFLIAKTRPHLKSLVKWNIVAVILVIVFFGSTAFLKCEPNTKYGEMLVNSSISLRCKCRFSEFQPVCMKSMTYYSPCFAGCRSVQDVNSRKTYNDCSYGGEAAEGPCNVEKCDIYYALSQVNRVFTTAVLASTLVTNLVINMRCILRRDKAAALGLEATFLGLIPYLPVKAIYGAVAEHYCIFNGDNSNICRLYSQSFGTFLSLCTMGFMVLSLILAVLVLLLLKLHPVSEKDEDDEDDEENDPVELTEMSSVPREESRLMTRDEVDARQSGSAHSVESMSPSLLEMENVGDDHDSIDSASHLDEPSDRLYKRRFTESDL